MVVLGAAPSLKGDYAGHMADVSPGGTPDQGAPPPSPEVAPAYAAPAPAAPAPAQPAPAQLAPGFASGAEATAVPVYHPAPFLPQPAEATPTVSDPRVDPVTGRARSGWRRWLPILAMIVVIVAGAIGMLLFLGVNYGGVALAIGLIAAVLPVPLLVSAFLWLDRYEPEPIRYLAFCFAWGACVATSIALIVNTLSSDLFEKIGLPDALVAVLVAPFIEESMKAAGPMLLFWRRREEWSGITDGIVYAGLSALGFAMVENVLYLGGHGYAAGAEQYGAATGLQNVFAIFIVRILFTGFAHPLFTSMTGIGLGISSRSGDRRVRWLAPIAGLLLAMMLHGTFNLLPTLSVSLSQPFIMLYGYLGFMVPFFFAVVGFAIALRGWEGRIVERILPYYVRTGWFAPPEVAALGSLGRRYSARQWARRVAGPAGQRAMKGFQFAATQLALLRDGMQRGLNRTAVSMRRAELEEQRLLAAIVDYRSTFTGRDPQSPQAFWNGENYQIAFPDGSTRQVSPPAEPVVPVPIRFAAPAYATPTSSPYGASPYYGAPSSYGATPAYGASPYGTPSPYEGSSAYGGSPAPGAPPSYGTAPDYRPPANYSSDYAPNPSYGTAASTPPAIAAPQPTPGYNTQPTPGYGPPPTSGYGPPPTSGYGPQPTSGYGPPPMSGYGAQGYGAEQTPGYGAQPTPAFGAQPTSGHGTQGYGAEQTPGYGTQPTPGYGVQPTSGWVAPANPGDGNPQSAAPAYTPPPASVPSNGSTDYATPGYPTPAPGPGYSAPSNGVPTDQPPAYGVDLTAAQPESPHPTTPAAEHPQPTTPPGE
jgi:RsiW-degrading membrane proteinase PrsW (M82 family)